MPTLQCSPTKEITDRSGGQVPEFLAQEPSYSATALGSAKKFQNLTCLGGSSPFKALPVIDLKLYCRQAICTIDGIPAGGLWLVEVTRREDVEQLVLDDPFWPTGLRRDARILACHRVFADSVRLGAQGVR